MNWRAWATAVSFALALATPAWADDVRVLTPGTPAPYPGLLLDEGAAAKVTVDLKKGRTLEAEVETMKAQLAAAQQEAQALRDANREMRGALDAADKALARVEKTMDAYDRALTKSNDLMDRQAKRIDQLESREKWAMIFGGLGLLIGAAIGAF